MTTTKRSTRTDPHRPGAIVPADYRPVTWYLLAGGGAFPMPPINLESVIRLQESGAKFAAHGGIGKCSVCGAIFNEGQVWRHEPTGEHIHVGFQCAMKYGMMADWSEAELARDRREAAKAVEIEKAAKARKRDAFLAKHPGLAEALQVEHRIIADIRERFIRWCEMSDKQVALVMKLADEVRNPTPKPEEKHIPAPTGRVTFVGTVVSTKVSDGAFGEQYKMVVKVTTEAGSWLAWMTVPAALLDSVPAGEQGRLQALRGRKVQVTAALSPGRDAHFAFGKRPLGLLAADDAVEGIVPEAPKAKRSRKPAAQAA